MKNCRNFSLLQQVFAAQFPQVYLQLDFRGAARGRLRPADFFFIFFSRKPAPRPQQKKADITPAAYLSRCLGSPRIAQFFQRFECRGRLGQQGRMRMVSRSGLLMAGHPGANCSSTASGPTWNSPVLKKAMVMYLQSVAPPVVLRTGRELRRGSVIAGGNVYFTRRNRRRCGRPPANSTGSAMVAVCVEPTGHLRGGQPIARPRGGRKAVSAFIEEFFLRFKNRSIGFHSPGRNGAQGVNAVFAEKVPVSCRFFRSRISWNSGGQGGVGEVGG